MSDERFKAWMSFWQFILGTMVLGIFSAIISHQIQVREVEIKEQESNAKFLEQAMQEEAGVRRRLAQYFSHVTRSSELRERWADYATVIEVEYQAKLKEKATVDKEIAAAPDAERRERLLDRAAQLTQELSPKIAVPAPALAPRLYMHIVEEGQRKAANSVAEALKASAIDVAGVERVKAGPDHTELRYFRRAERAEAEGIASSIRQLGVPPVARYIPGYELSTTMRPRHYELWISSSNG